MPSSPGWICCLQLGDGRRAGQHRLPDERPLPGASRGLQRPAAYAGTGRIFPLAGLSSPGGQPSLYNPPEGFIVTANQDLNRYGRAPVINLCTLASLPGRAHRRAKLPPRGNWMPPTCRGCITTSIPGRPRGLHEYHPPAPAGYPNGQLLADWDLRYHSGSREATLFERVYLELVKIVFGQYGSRAAGDGLHHGRDHPLPRLLRKLRPLAARGGLPLAGGTTRARN